MTSDTTLEKLSRSNADGRPPGSASPLVELLTLLILRRRLLLAITAVGSALSLAIVFWLTPLYAATAVIIPPPKAQSLASAMMGQLGAMASSLSPALGLKDPADLTIGILKSRTINEAIISRFDLMRVYSVDLRADALKKLNDRVSFVSSKDSFIRITVEDADPKRAAGLANAYIAELYKQNNRLALTESGQRRLFFERSLQEEKTALAEAEDHLKQSQEKSGVLQVSSQVEGVISLIAQVRAQIAGREVELQRLKLGATPQNPEVKGLENEIAALRSQLAKLESKSTTGQPGDPIIPFANVPQGALETLRMLREVKYHETLFEVLAKQYEAAKIDEAKESQAIQVVDTAVPPERRSWPPRLALTILGALSFAILGCVYVFAEDALARFARRLRSRISLVGGNV